MKTDLTDLRDLLEPIAVTCERIQREIDTSAESLRDARRARAQRIAILRGIEPAPAPVRLPDSLR